jgi:hypothetical protein
MAPKSTNRRRTDGCTTASFPSCLLSPSESLSFSVVVVMRPAPDPLAILWSNNSIAPSGVPPIQEAVYAGTDCASKICSERSWSKAKAVSGHSDSDGMGSIPASPDARNVPFLLCQERFNEASLPVRSYGPHLKGCPAINLSILNKFFVLNIVPRELSFQFSVGF